jgi:hypothetical protein
MEITEQKRSAIPPDNVQVSVDEFCEFWAFAGRECLRLVLAIAPGEVSWESSYASGALGTVRWLAASDDGLGPEYGPFRTSSGELAGRANPDSIRLMRDETQQMMLKFPDGYRTDSLPPRPGYLEGVRDTFRWARADGPVPRLGTPQSEFASVQ